MISQRINWIEETKNLLKILLGSALMAVAISLFLVPAKIITGGTPGLAMIIYFLSDISMGVAMLLVNIPLLIAGFHFVDLGFAIRSIITMIITAVLVDVTAAFVPFPELHSLLLSTLYGGILAGIGIALVLKAQASAGGTSIVARILSQYTSIRPAQTVLFMDLMILMAVGFIFRNMEQLLWSMISIYVTAQVIDKLLTGAVSEKIVHIVSDQYQAISQAIQQQLHRDGTLLPGTSFDQQQNKQILFVVVHARRLPALRKLVKTIDPEAIMVVIEASEVLGNSRLREGLKNTP
ncbi:YitT family protein [Marinicella gelatinilytica]|uniref:YitT family protein n=1 Tax=Marinicella gelatinilytica TaxID=2996017 RepID=UPI002260D172|nr:YitT family protein [Marinicella gelatinilytica]MCX7544647.1 YitT family protein [Marinicella gelatinilytica]